MADDSDTGDSAVDDPIVEMKQSELNRLMGKTRREGAASAGRKSEAATTAPQTIAEIVAATVKALQPAEPERQRPAAAPSAPNAGLPTNGGLVDIFAPGVAQALGPRELRVHLERLWQLGHEMAGGPDRPKRSK